MTAAELNTDVGRQHLSALLERTDKHLERYTRLLVEASIDARATGRLGRLRARLRRRSLQRGLHRLERQRGAILATMRDIGQARP